MSTEQSEDSYTDWLKRIRCLFSDEHSIAKSIDELMLLTGEKKRASQETHNLLDELQAQSARSDPSRYETRNKLVEKFREMVDLTIEEAEARLEMTRIVREYTDRIRAKRDRS